MVYKYECNAMRKGSSVCHIQSLALSQRRELCVCVCRGAQLFFNLGTEVREREGSRLLTWLLCSKVNRKISISMICNIRNKLFVKSIIS